MVDQLDYSWLHSLEVFSLETPGRSTFEKSPVVMPQVHLLLPPMCPLMPKGPPSLLPKSLHLLKRIFEIRNGISTHCKWLKESKKHMILVNIRLQNVIMPMNTYDTSGPKKLLLETEFDIHMELTLLFLLKHLLLMLEPLLLLLESHFFFG